MSFPLRPKLQPPAQVIPLVEDDMHNTSSSLSSSSPKSSSSSNSHSDVEEKKIENGKGSGKLTNGKVKPSSKKMKRRSAGRKVVPLWYLTKKLQISANWKRRNKHSVFQYKRKAVVGVSIEEYLRHIKGQSSCFGKTAIEQIVFPKAVPDVFGGVQDASYGFADFIGRKGIQGLPFEKAPVGKSSNSTTDTEKVPSITWRTSRRKSSPKKKATDAASAPQEINEKPVVVLDRNQPAESDTEIQEAKNLELSKKKSEVNRMGFPSEKWRDDEETKERVAKEGPKPKATAKLAEITPESLSIKKIRSKEASPSPGHVSASTPPMNTFQPAADRDIDIEKLDTISDDTLVLSSSVPTLPIIIPENNMVKLKGRHVMRNVIETNQPVDTILSLKDGKVGAHRIVLVAVSEFLEELLIEQEALHTLTLILPDITKRTMETLLSLAYTGKLIYFESEEEDVFSAIETLRFCDDVKLTMQIVSNPKPRSCSTNATPGTSATAILGLPEVGDEYKTNAIIRPIPAPAKVQPAPAPTKVQPAPAPTKVQPAPAPMKVKGHGPPSKPKEASPGLATKSVPKPLPPTTQKIVKPATVRAPAPIPSAVKGKGTPMAVHVPEVTSSLVGGPILFWDPLGGLPALPPTKPRHVIAKKSAPTASVSARPNYFSAKGGKSDEELMNFKAGVLDAEKLTAGLNQKNQLQHMDLMAAEQPDYTNAVVGNGQLFDHIAQYLGIPDLKILRQTCKLLYSKVNANRKFISSLRLTISEGTIRENGMCDSITWKNVRIVVSRTSSQHFRNIRTDCIQELELLHPASEELTKLTNVKNSRLALYELLELRQFPNLRSMTLDLNLMCYDISMGAMTSVVGTVKEFRFQWVGMYEFTPKGIKGRNAEKNLEMIGGLPWKLHSFAIEGLLLAERISVAIGAIPASSASTLQELKLCSVQFGSESHIHGVRFLQLKSIGLEIDAYGEYDGRPLAEFLLLQPQLESIEIKFYGNGRLTAELTVLEAIRRTCSSEMHTLRLGGAVWLKSFPDFGSWVFIRDLTRLKNVMICGMYTSRADNVVTEILNCLPSGTQSLELHYVHFDIMEKSGTIDPLAGFPNLVQLKLSTPGRLGGRKLGSLINDTILQTICRSLIKLRVLHFGSKEITDFGLTGERSNYNSRVSLRNLKGLQDLDISGLFEEITENGILKAIQFQELRNLKLCTQISKYTIVEIASHNPSLEDFAFVPMYAFGRDEARFDEYIRGLFSSIMAVNPRLTRIHKADICLRLEEELPDHLICRPSYSVSANLANTTALSHVRNTTKIVKSSKGGNVCFLLLWYS